MQFKSVPSWWPVCLLALYGAAHADSEPYSVGVNETVQHQSNVSRGPDADRQADWISTTEFQASLDQQLGRDELTAQGTFDINRYKKVDGLDSNTYAVAGAFNWNTVGDLSGSLGADSRRRQYYYGLDGEVVAPDGTTTITPELGHSLENDNHVFANVQLGGLARWSLFVGADANQRTYTNSLFSASDERQWSAHGGTNYSTSPDLSFGITGVVTHGVYPHFMLGEGHDGFDMKSVDLTTKWQVSGASSLDAKVGYTDAHYSAQPASKFVNGALNWSWKPPSHFAVAFGLSRDTDSDTAITGAIVNSNSVVGRSINNVAHISVDYELTAKTTLNANAAYTERRYSGAVVPTTAGGLGGTLDGTNHTMVYGLTARYKPTRTTDLSCSLSRERRTADASLATVTPAYSDNIYFCAAGITFD